MQSTGRVWSSVRYQDAAAKVSYCTNNGRLAEAAWHFKNTGVTKDSLIERLQKAGKFRGDRADSIIQYTVDYTYDKATDLVDAKTSSWAYCMDRLG
jgi:hypothetical protein